MGVIFIKNRLSTNIHRKKTHNANPLKQLAKNNTW